MSTILNNYIIEDFIKLKPIIYEYCVNLTQKKTNTSWFRDFSDADDLYQEVFLYVHDNYFNKPKEPMQKGKFVQIMKNCTYWAYQRRLSRANSAIYRNLNKIYDSEKDFFLFEQTHNYTPDTWLDFENSVDYKYYTKDLNIKELNALKMFFEGYPYKDIDDVGGYRGYFNNIVRVKLKKIVNKEPIVLAPIDKVEKAKIEIQKLDIDENHATYLRSKIKNFDAIFYRKKASKKKAKDKFITIYSLYLQKVPITQIADMFKISKHQISVEVFRIKSLIKKYGGEQ